MPNQTSLSILRVLHPSRFVARVAIVLGLMVWGVSGQAPAQAAEHSIGLGAHFWKTVDDLADDGFGDIEDEGYAYVVSWKIEPQGIFFAEFELEYYGDGFGGTNSSATSPIAFVGVGHGLYAAAGVGVTFASEFEDDVSDPFWVGRIGFDFKLLPGIGVDISADYRADSFSELDQASTDSITLGAKIRIAF